MDSNKKKYIPGILIMTLIFLGLSIFSIYNMNNKNDGGNKASKGSYVTLLEKELGVTLDGDDDFDNFSKLGYDVLVVPSKYEDYFKPCFDFVIVRDGIIVKNRLSSEFDKYPLEVGSKITQINDKVLNGLGYFEILDLIYSSSLNVTKTFTLSNDTKFSYTYEKYNTKEEVLTDENSVTIKFYNLDKITRKGVYSKVSGYENVVFDFSSATITDFTAIKGFVSFFSNADEELFSTPAGIKGYESYKLNNVNIILGDNKDLGILFLATTIKKLNSTVTFDKTDLTTTTYMCQNTISNRDYVITIYNYEVSTSKSINDGVIV